MTQITEYNFSDVLIRNKFIVEDEIYYIKSVDSCTYTITFPSTFNLSNMYEFDWCVDYNHKLNINSCDLNTFLTAISHFISLT